MFHTVEDLRVSLASISVADIPSLVVTATQTTAAQSFNSQASMVSISETITSFSLSNPIPSLLQHGQEPGDEAAALEALIKEREALERAEDIQKRQQQSAKQLEIRRQLAAEKLRIDILKQRAATSSASGGAAASSGSSWSKQVFSS